MTNLKNLYTPETKALLEGVKQTNLPVVIEGSTETGVTTLANYFRDYFNYGLIDGFDNFDINDEETNKAIALLYKSMTEGKGNNIVIVKQKPTEFLLNSIGKHIKIKTFYDSKTEQKWFHIIPSFSIENDNSKLLGTKHPIVLVVGELVKDFKSDICKKENVITIDINSDEDFNIVVETLLKTIKTLMQQKRVEKFLDIQGASATVLRLDLNLTDPAITLPLLYEIKKYPDKYGIYIQGHINDSSMLKTEIVPVFPIKIY